MALRIEDSRKLLVKVVGTEKGLTQQDFARKMRSFLVVRVKNYLAMYIKQERVSIFEIDEHLLNISAKLHEQFIPDFIDYGVSMERFFVTTIVKPEDDSNYIRFKELYFRKYADIAEAQLKQKAELIEQETQKQRLIMEAEGLAQKRQLEGFSYQTQRGFDVAETVAANEATGAMTNVGMGLGMMAGVGMGVGGAVGGVVGGAIQDTMGSAFGSAQHQPLRGVAQNTVICGKCGKSLPAEAKFCHGCGQQVSADKQIICPSCGKATPKGKFCLECGALTVRICPACNKVMPPDGKFCLECGQKLELEQS